MGVKHGEWSLVLYQSIISVRSVMPISEGPCEIISLNSSFNCLKAWCTDLETSASFNFTWGLVYVLCLPINAVFSKLLYTCTGSTT